MDEVEVFELSKSIEFFSFQTSTSYSIFTMNVFSTNLPWDESIHRFHKN
jgi:hypothetical protein